MIDPVAENKRFETLIRNVFGSGQGKELLESLSVVYCDGKLCFDDDRSTVYAVAQRDLVLEFKHISQSGEIKQDGVEVS